MSGAATSLRGSAQAGRQAAFAATGGSMQAAGGAPSSGFSAAASSPPDWAQRLRRDQAMSHGVSTAAHAVRAGDQGGGSSSISLQQD
jgi:type IV secretion system protein TrbL